jgi:hypothetical protein
LLYGVPVFFDDKYLLAPIAAKRFCQGNGNQLAATPARARVLSI